MRAEILDNLPLLGVGYDLETHLIQPGNNAPPVVCGSVASYRDGRFDANYGSKEEAAQALDAIASSDSMVLVGANIAFDVICELVHGAQDPAKIFRMYDRDNSAIHGKPNGRVIDVLTGEKLHAIARGWLGLNPFTQKKITDPVTKRPGSYSLNEVVKQVLGRDNAKVNDRFRLSYALLESIPISQWPADATAYLKDDAINPLEAALAQAGHLPNVGPHNWMGINRWPWLACSQCGVDQSPTATIQCTSTYRRLNSHMLSRETYFAFCLALGAAWGYRIDQDAVTALETKWHADHDQMQQPFMDAGILRMGADGLTHCHEAVLKKCVARAYGSKDGCPICTATGKVPSVKTEGRTKINCKDCDGTGLLLSPTCPRSKSGEVGMSRDALSESGNEMLAGYALYGESAKIPSVYIPYLRNRDKDKVEHPDVPRLLRPNNPLETDRVSYFGATMLLPRHGGVRECHVARSSLVFSSEDYKAGELVTHAQNCLEIVGFSRLAEALNLGLDAHLALAAQIIGIPYDEAVKRKKAGDHVLSDTRQVCKPPNFGFPGRMGAAKLTQQQRKQMDVHTPWAQGPHWIYPGDGSTEKVRGYKGLRFCLMMKMADRCGEVLLNTWKGRPVPMLCKKCIECAEQLKVQWGIQWPENKPYFKHVGEMADRAEQGYPVKMPHSHFLRGFKRGQVDDDGNPINYGNAIANGYFQHRLAFAAGNAYMAATRECYDPTVRVRSFTKYTSKYEGQQSPLWMSRLPQFQHDEIIGEHSESVAADAAARITELMEESLRLVCPDMADGKAIEAKPTLMRRITKGAEAVFNKAGKLIPWDDRELGL